MRDPVTAVNTANNEFKQRSTTPLTKLKLSNVKKAGNTPSSPTKRTSYFTNLIEKAKVISPLVIEDRNFFQPATLATITVTDQLEEELFQDITGVVKGLPYHHAILDLKFKLAVPAPRRFGHFHKNNLQTAIEKRIIANDQTLVQFVSFTFQQLQLFAVAQFHVTLTPHSQLWTVFVEVITETAKNCTDFIQQRSAGLGNARFLGRHPVIPLHEMIYKAWRRC
jgi:hypothetical protein